MLSAMCAAYEKHRVSGDLCTRLCSDRDWTVIDYHERNKVRFGKIVIYLCGDSFFCPHLATRQFDKLSASHTQLSMSATAFNRQVHPKRELVTGLGSSLVRAVDCSSIDRGFESFPRHLISRFRDGRVHIRCRWDYSLLH